MPADLGQIEFERPAADLRIAEDAAAGAAEGAAGGDADKSDDAALGGKSVITFTDRDLNDVRSRPQIGDEVGAGWSLPPSFYFCLFCSRALNSANPNPPPQVEFSIVTIKRNKQERAAMVDVIKRGEDAKANGRSKVCRGLSASGPVPCVAHPYPLSIYCRVSFPLLRTRLVSLRPRPATAKCFSTSGAGASGGGRVQGGRRLDTDGFLCFSLSLVRVAPVAHSEYAGDAATIKQCSRVWYSMATRQGGKVCAVRVTPMSDEDVERVEVRQNRGLHTQTEVISVLMHPCLPRAGD